MKSLSLILTLCFFSFAASAVKRYPNSATAPYSGNAQTICQGASNTATSVTYAICSTTGTGAALSVTPHWYLNGAIVFNGTAFNSANGGGTITLPAGSFTYSTPGTFTGANGLKCVLTWTGASPAACGAVTTITGTSTKITVTATPPAISGPNSVCIGSSIALSNGTSGGTWSSSNSSIATCVLATGIVTGATVGNVTISYKIGGCTVTSPVAVHALPAAITGATAVCAGGTIYLSDATTGGAWTSGNTTMATISATGTVSGVSSGTPRITYTSSFGCIRTTTVTVNPIPPTIQGPSLVCTAATIALSNSAAGGTWSSSNTLIAAIAGTGIVTGVSLGNATITYTLPTTCLTTKTVTVDPAPVAGTITGALIVCPGTTTLLSDASPGGVWSSQSSGIATIDPSGTVTGVNAGSSTISYTVTNNCGVAVATATVTVPPIAVGPITGPTAVCQNATITLGNSTPGGTWSSVTPAVATISPTGSVTGVLPGSTVIYYLIVNSCGSAGAILTVTVDEPNAGTITGTSALCVGTSASLSDPLAGGIWSSSNTAITINTSGSFTGNTVGSAVISYAIINSCGTAISTASVTVNGAPASVGPILGGTAVCDGSVLHLTNAVAGGQWGTTASGIVAVNSATGNVTGLSVGVAGISYVIANACGSSVAAENVTVYPLPSMPVILQNGAALRTSVAYTGYQWILSGSPITGATNATYNATANGTYSVTVANDHGCTATSVGKTIAHVGINNIPTDDDHIKIYPNPVSNVLIIAASEKVSIAIFDMTGKVLIDQKDAAQIDVSKLTPGLYIIKIYDQDGSLIRIEKFAKVKE